jgi:hypothetical protein
MKQKYVIREIVTSDCQQISEIAKKSWLFTYKGIYEEDFILKHIQKSYTVDSLKKNILSVDEGFSKFFVLVQGDSNHILGFAQVGYNAYWENGKNNLPLRLFRIYLDPEELGKGLGNLLLQKVEEFVLAEEQKSYIVGVHEKNSIGLRFYEKNGFEYISKKSDREGEIYLKKNLV